MLTVRNTAEWTKIKILKITIFLGDRGVDAALLNHDDEPPLSLPGAGQADPGCDILQAQSQKGFRQPLDVRLKQRVFDLLQYFVWVSETI
jgi:hypothetical protein